MAAAAMRAVATVTVSTCSFVATALNLRVAGCDSELDLVFVLDLSGSVEEAYGMVLELARRTVSGLNVDRASGTRVAVITYSDQATVKFYLDEYSSTDDVLDALVFRRAGACSFPRRCHFTSPRTHRTHQSANPS